MFCLGAGISNLTAILRKMIVDRQFEMVHYHFNKFFAGLENSP